MRAGIDTFSASGTFICINGGEEIFYLDCTKFAGSYTSRTTNTSCFAGLSCYAALLLVVAGNGSSFFGINDAYNLFWTGFGTKTTAAAK